MATTTVRSHTRRGYQVRSHSRRTNGRQAADYLRRGPIVRPTVVNDCQHPAWYPIYELDSDRIQVYACTDCAATRLPDAEGIEWVPLRSEGQP